MNLKEAFRYQNKLSDLLSQAEGYLADAGYITQVKEIHLRSQADPTAADEVQYSQALPEAYLPPANVMVQFLLEMLHVKEQLTSAIYAAKKQQAFDLDGASALNVQRQEAARTLRLLASLRSSEERIPSGGVGYRFNQEGNQITYRCDLKRVTTINYDRLTVRKAAQYLSRSADEASSQIDRCLLDTPVDFEPPFDVNATFAEIIEDYADQHK